MTLGSRRPKNQKEAIVWNRYSGPQSVLPWPLREWPWSMQANILELHTNQRARLNFFYFLVHNAISPAKAKGVIFRCIRELKGDIDTSTFAQLAKLELESNRGKYYSNTYWNMDHRRYVTLPPAHPATNNTLIDAMNQARRTFRSVNR